MRYLLFLFILLAGACTLQQPITSGPSQNNKDYTVQYLFEHEGCKVYRFKDQGNYIYFTNCIGQAIARTDSTIIQNSTRLKN